MDDFTAPIHQGLTTPILITGLPRTVAFVLWTTAFALGFGLREVWVLPFFIVLQMGLAHLTRKDPYFFSILRLAIKVPRTLKP